MLRGEESEVTPNLIDFVKKILTWQRTFTGTELSQWHSPDVWNLDVCNTQRGLILLRGARCDLKSTRSESSSCMTPEVASAMIVVANLEFWQESV